MIGTNFPYTQHLPQPGKVRVVQIERDPVRAGVRMPTEAPVIGDAKEGLQALIPLLIRRADRGHLEKYQKAMAGWRSDDGGHETPGARRSPRSTWWRCSTNWPPTTRCSPVTAAPSATWAARHWQIRGGREFFLSGNLATMAPGLPYAIGIQHAFPGRQVIGYVGDGGFAMLMAEFITAVKHELPVKIVINNNNSLGQILWEQMVLGYPEHGVRYQSRSPTTPPWPPPNGGSALKVDKPAEVAARDQEAWPTTARRLST